MAHALRLGYATFNKGFRRGKVMAVSGKTGAWDPGNISDPVDTDYVLDAEVEDTVLQDYIYQDRLQVLAANIVTNEPTETTSTCSYTLLEPSNMNPEDWSNVRAKDVVLQYPAGTNVATNPHGLVQVGEKLFIIDFDSRKLVILGAGELDGLGTGNHPLANAPYDLGTAAGLSATARGQALIAMQNSAGASFLFALYLDYDNRGKLKDSILVRLSVDPDDGSLAYETQTNVGKNAQEIWAIFKGTSDADALLVIPAIGGEQQAGSSNGTASNLSGIPAFGTWPAKALVLFTGDPPASSTKTYPGPEPANDIRVFVSTLRPWTPPPAPQTGEDAETGEEGPEFPVFILAGGFTSDYRGANYRLYKTGVGDIFDLYDDAVAGKPTPAISSLVPDTLTVVKSGQAYSAAD
ncbi:MAG: hypothetical protein LBF63_10785, partial [Treponema sp.]|nr:hypothetical protein [Treponema sp.]